MARGRSTVPERARQTAIMIPMKSLSYPQIGELFCDGVVRHGPFAGLQYPELTAVGSALYPKLLGSYQREIQGWIEEICAAGYSEIVDVGFAEGYYAVGLARRLPRAGLRLRHQRRGSSPVRTPSP